MRRRRLTYRTLEEDPSYEHQVDRLVRVRVGRRDPQRTAADASTAVVKALGPKKRLWFRYERAADELRARREAAYFDAGVDLGTAAVGLAEWRSQRRALRDLGWKLAREALTSGATREEALAAAVMTAWALVVGVEARKGRRGSR